MFPINWNDAFRKKDGTMTTIGDVIASGGGGGGGSGVDGVIIGEEEPTEDIGENGDYYLQIDVSGNIPVVTNTFKKVNDNWVNSLVGYNVKSHSTGSYDASLDISQIVFDELVLITTVPYQGPFYSDDYVAVSYTGGYWVLTPNQTMYDDNGDVVTETRWTYGTSQDITWYIDNPTE